MCDRSHLGQGSSDCLDEGDPHAILMELVNEHPNASDAKIQKLLLARVKGDEKALRAILSEVLKDWRNNELN